MAKELKELQKECGAIRDEMVNRKAVRHWPPAAARETTSAKRYGGTPAFIPATILQNRLMANKLNYYKLKCDFFKINIVFF